MSSNRSLWSYYQYVVLMGLISPLHWESWQQKVTKINKINKNGAYFNLFLLYGSGFVDFCWLLLTSERIECMRNRVFALSICAFVRSSTESAVLTCALKRQIRWRLQIWFAVHVYHAASCNCYINSILSHFTWVSGLIMHRNECHIAWYVWLYQYLL